MDFHPKQSTNMNYKELYKKFCDYLEIISRDYKISKPIALISLVSCYLRHGASPTSWFMFKMYKLNERGRKRIITAKRNDELDALFNSPKNADFFNNKALFNKEFSEFIKRDWVLLSKVSNKGLNKFLENHDEVVVKPIGLSSGIGVQLLSSNQYDKINSLDKSTDWLIEERVICHPDLQKLNPHSCNTIRVYTLVDNAGKIHILGTYLKVGGGTGICDNFHNKGIMYSVDLNHGVVDRPGLDFALKEHVVHPGTDFIMPGRKIPLFNEVKECAVKAQKLYMKSRFIAWDIAITPDGCEIIEGNYAPNCNLLQIFNQEGCYLKLKEML